MNSDYEKTVVSVIVPVYNEEKILEYEIAEMIGELNRRNFTYELMLVENGSRDNTYEIAIKLKTKYSPKIKVIKLETADYGAALREGFLSAKGKYMFNFSMDFYDFNFLDTAMKLLETHDIVAGSKQLEKSDGRPLMRRVISAGFYLIFRYLFHAKTFDTHGIKGFNREKIIDIVKKCKSRRALFDTELILRAESANIKIIEIPVRVVEKRPAKLGLIMQVLIAAVDIVRLKFILLR